MKSPQEEPSVSLRDLIRIIHSKNEWENFLKRLNSQAISALNRFPILVGIIEKEDLKRIIINAFGNAQHIYISNHFDVSDTKECVAVAVVHTIVEITKIIREFCSDTNIWQNKLRPGPRSIDQSITRSVEEALRLFSEEISYQDGDEPFFLNLWFNLGRLVQRTFYYDPDMWDFWHIYAGNLDYEASQPTTRQRFNNQRLADLLNQDLCSARRNWTAEQVREKRRGALLALTKILGVQSDATDAI